MQQQIGGCEFKDRSNKEGCDRLLMPADAARLRREASSPHSGRTLGIAALCVTLGLAGGCASRFDQRNFVAGLRDPVPNNTAVRRISSQGLQRESNPYVVGIHGLAIEVMGDFSRTIASDLGAGTPQVVSVNRWADTMEGTKGAILRGQPVIYISHSLGNNKVLEDVLRALAAAGKSLKAWVMVDASYLQDGYPLPPKEEKRPIPSNVELIVNMYSRGHFNGRALQASDFADPSKVDIRTLLDLGDEQALRSAARLWKEGRTLVINCGVPEGHLGMANSRNAHEIAGAIRMIEASRSLPRTPNHEFIVSR